MNLNKTLDRRNFILGLGAAAGAAMLAGCGGNSGAGAAASTDSANAASYTLVQDGKIIVASDLANPPFDYVDVTTAVGFEVDLMDAVAAKMGLTCEYLPAMKFDSIIPLIKQGGKADCGVSNFTITDERKQEIDFTDPYIDSNQGVVVKADSDKTTAEALNADGVKIACQSGTTGEAWAQENLPKATVKPLDDIIQCLQGVTSGLYDCSVCDLPVARYEIKIAYSGLDVAMEIPTGEQYGLVVSKDNPGLTKAINQALSDLESDGTIDKLEEKWFGEAL